MPFARGACALAFFLAPLVAVLAALGVAPLAAGLALALLPQALRGAPLRRLRAPGLLAAALLCAWAMLSALWSVDGGFSAVMSLRLLGIMLIGAIVLSGAEAVSAEAPPAAAPLRGLALGLWFAGALLIVALVAHAAPAAAAAIGLPAKATDLATFKRAATILAVLVWPATAYLWSRSSRTEAALLALIMVLVILAHDSVSAKLALLLGGGAAYTGYRYGKRALSVAFAILAAGFLLMPVLAALIPPIDALTDPASEAAAQPEFSWFAAWNPDIAVSSLHRLAIWRFTAQHIAERVWTGWGFEASRFLARPRDAVDGHSLLPLHPHNAILQIWVELGAVGAALSLFALHRGYHALARRLSGAGEGRAGPAGLLGALAAASCISLVSYGVWQSWWLATMIISIAALLSLRQPAAAVGPRSKGEGAPARQPAALTSP